MTAEAQIEKWCEDSQELVDVVCALAPGDAALLRGRLVPFMAMFNYRNVVRLKGSWLGRLRAFRTVRRHFGAPNRPTELVRELVWQTPWFETLRRVRRAYRRK
jgi:hypothetical protein